MTHSVVRDIHAVDSQSRTALGCLVWTSQPAFLWKAITLITTWLRASRNLTQTKARTFFRMQATSLV